MYICQAISHKANCIYRVKPKRLLLRTTDPIFPQHISQNHSDSINWSEFSLSQRMVGKTHQPLATPIFISVPCSSPWHTNYKTNYLRQCIVLKSFVLLKTSTHIKINFKSYSNMFRSHWTIIREHVVPIPKLPLIIY